MANGVPEGNSRMTFDCQLASDVIPLSLPIILRSRKRALAPLIQLADAGGNKLPIWYIYSGSVIASWDKAIPESGVDVPVHPIIANLQE